MVKYVCDKCNNYIKRKILKVATVDEHGEKNTYHLCAECSLTFISFMSEPVVKEPNKLKSSVMQAVEEAGIVNTSDEVPSSVKEPVEEAMVPTTETTAVKQDIGYSGRRSKHLTDEVREYIRDNCNSKTAKQMALELGIPYNSVYQVVRNLREHCLVPKAGPDTRLKGEDVGRVHALYGAGWKIKEIASEIGCDEYEVTEVLGGVAK